MFNWAKQQMANVAGTQEPIYGPTAIQSVLDQAKETPYTELKKEHMKWRALNKTNVETQCFYFQTNEGKTAMAQVIYSNVAGIRTTVQFNSKIFNHADGKEPNLWCSDPLENVKFDNDKYSISATNCSVELSEDGSTYTIKSSTSKKNIVELKVKRTAPGFMVGKDGTSYYGTDPQQPWGEMHHRFWPRCEVEGTMMTQAGQVNCAGRGMFVHALQGMKPHHAAARWNFVDFQSPTYSAVMMEFTTPPSYGTTVVTVGGIATDGKLLYAGPGCTAKHTEVKADAENEWPEPSATSYHWEGQKFSADLGGSLEKRIDRIDVMAEVPGFVKAIVASAAGTKPYIYQYIPKMTLKIKEGGEEKSEEGVLFTEATFISREEETNLDSSKKGMKRHAKH